MSYSKSIATKTSDPDLVQLGGYSVYKHPGRNKIIKVNEHFYNIPETNYDTSPTGLDAMVVENVDSGEVSIIYEGTQSEEKNQDVLNERNT